MQKNKPLFSVVTATYNRYSYLKILYKSLVSQSFKNIEWVIGNDGSSMKYSKGLAHSIAINHNTHTFNKLRLAKRIWSFTNYWRYIYHGDINFFKGKKMWVITRKLSFYFLLIPLSILLCIRDMIWKKIEKTHLEFEKNKNIAKIKYVK